MEDYVDVEDYIYDPFWITKDEKKLFLHEMTRNHLEAVKQHLINRKNSEGVVYDCICEELERRKPPPPKEDHIPEVDKKEKYNESKTNRPIRDS